MSGFVVHAVPGSPYCRAALATLEEKGAAYRYAAVAPGALQASRMSRATRSAASRCSSTTASCSTRPRQCCATSTASCRPRR